MKLPRDLSGEKLARLLCRDWNYQQVNQVGSHIILQTRDPSPQRIAVPSHKTLRIGTLNGILRAIASHKNVSREDILSSL